MSGFYQPKVPPNTPRDLAEEFRALAEALRELRALIAALDVRVTALEP